ncbi:MAG: hypothetical protein K9M84_05775 [Spirochaetia bacterium]|nr:hypothetical protein [Spirochaetia bacterium]
MCCVIISPLAADNYQKIFPIDSQEFEAIEYLYIDQGLSLPSTSGPWSAAELRLMLKKIDLESLSGPAENLYEFASSSLNEAEENRVSDSLAMSFDSTLAVEAYYHTNTDVYTSEQLWRYDFEEREPLYTGSFETWASDLFYGDIDLIVGLNPFRETNDSSDLFGDAAVTTNILMVPPSVITDLDMNMPYRAFAAVGGDHWSLQFGRDNVAWGAGETGNLMIGGHLKYQDLLRFTTFHDSYKFTSLYSFFPHPVNYADNEPVGQAAPLEGLKMFVGHRLEFRMFDDTVNFALSESMMYMSEEGVLSLGLLNPLMIYHDNYIRANSNSLLTLELEAAPFRNWSIYGQFAVDEFPLPGEDSTGSSSLPTAMGYLAGIKTAYTAGDGVVYGLLEGAFTDPFLYLRGNGKGGDQTDLNGINYVVGVRSFSPDGNISIAQDFLGYEYGCDAVVLNLTAGYKVFKQYYVEGTLFGMLHGVNDLYTYWAEGSDTDPDPSQAETPTDSEYTDNALGETRDAVETTIMVELKGGYHILPQLEVYGQFDWIQKMNFNNLAANGTESDMQLAIGTTFSF